MHSGAAESSFDAATAAAALVRARRAGAGLEHYPGALPPDLDAAYRCQDAAIALWDDVIIGWKVGWIPAPLSERFGSQRLVGPIFARGLRRVPDSSRAPAPVFKGGFAAIEAEFVFELSRDAPAEVLDWSVEAARSLVKTMYVGVEIASSPLRDINDRGPAVIASDFGNNAGLLLGAEVRDWQRRAPGSLACETTVGGVIVGRGSAATVSGGPLAALAFALGCNARRGRPLRAGQLITTGAATGVHPIAPGQTADVVFAGITTLRCVAISVTPVA